MSGRERTSRYRAYCFTWNNYPEDFVDHFDTVFSVYSMKYVVVGLETAPETGTRHLQGFVSFSRPVPFTKVRECLPGCHIENMRGTVKQAVNYCKKGGNFREWGDCPNQGARNDLSAIAELASSGKNLQDLIGDISGFQALRTLQVLLPLVEPPRDKKPVVIYLHGPTGSGKTRLAMHLLSRPYTKEPSLGKWWDGYDRHQHVLIDDLRPGDIPFATLLRLLDRYPVRVEIKGGSRQFVATLIIITTALGIDHFRPSLEDDSLSQLLRRVDVIHHLEQEWTPSQEVPPAILALCGPGLNPMENGNQIEEIVD